MIYLTEKEKTHKESLLAKCNGRWVRLYRDRKSLSDYYWHVLDRLLFEKTILLDLGAGKKGMSSLFQNRIGVSIGLDISHEDLLKNNTIGYRICGDAQNLPFKNDCFDFIVSQWLLEHLPFPQKFLRESSRILRPKGSLLIVSNSLLCPFMLLNAVMPARFRDWLKKLFLPSEVEEDTYPTYYRANTRGQLARKARRTGLKETYFIYASDLSFFVFNRILFGLWLLLDRLTDKAFLKPMRMHFLAIYRKDG
jgi:SAM-dependent methyltransferase